MDKFKIHGWRIDAVNASIPTHQKKKDNWNGEKKTHKKNGSKWAISCGKVAIIILIHQQIYVWYRWYNQCNPSTVVTNRAGRAFFAGSQ